MRNFTPAALGLAIAFVAAYAAFQFAPYAVRERLFFEFAVLPIRFAANSPAPFTHWWETIGPLVGHAFLHGGWLHLGMNTLIFLQGAPLVERRLGAARFLVLFIVSAAGGALAYVLINPASQIPAVGASGAVCGVFGAYFLAVRRDWKSALAEPQIRNGVAVFLFVNVGLAALARVTGFLPIAWEAHLGGFIGGALAYPLLARPIRAGPWG